MHFAEVIAHVVCQQVHVIAGIIAKEQIAFLIDAQGKHHQEHQHDGHVVANTGQADVEIRAPCTSTIQQERFNIPQTNIQQDCGRAGIFPGEQADECNIASEGGRIGTGMKNIFPQRDAGNGGNQHGEQQ